MGDSEVKHQIDVTIAVNGTTKRVLIECKDYDISGDKVGLDIVRNFRSVIEDTKPDEGIIITCNGYTADAAKFAKSKGIRLSILRLFETSDINGRVQKVILNIGAGIPENPRVTVSISDPAEAARFTSLSAGLSRSGGVQANDGLSFVKENEKIQFNQFLSERMCAAIDLKNLNQTSGEVTVLGNGWELVFVGQKPIKFDYIKVTFDVRRCSSQIEITSKRIAELIVNFGVEDMIIYGDQLERRRINDETGEIF